MKAFNLEEALAGKPVVTRDGRKITELHAFKCKSDYPVMAVIDNESIYQFMTNGKYFKSEKYHESDLFMAPEKVTKYVNVYRQGNNGFSTSNSYDTESDALFYKDEDCIATVPITFEI